MRILLSALLLGCLVACQVKPIPSAKNQSQAFLDGVADACGLPRDTFRLLGDNHLQMQPRADADYKSVDCALSKLGQQKVLKLGFVGNEAINNGAQ